MGAGLGRDARRVGTGHVDQGVTAQLARAPARVILEVVHARARGAREHLNLADDDSITFFGELTLSPDGAEVETANLHFNDLIGPAHLVNLTVGGSNITAGTGLVAQNVTTTVPGSTAAPNPGPFTERNFVITVGTGGGHCDACR